MAKEGVKMKRWTRQVELRELKAMVQKQEEKVKASICTFSFITATVKTLALVFFYYIFSIGLTFYNRHLFQGSNLALSITLCHLVIKFVASGLVRLLLECKTKSPRVMLGWESYVKRVAPAGLVSSLDIGLSNWSFEMITISLYTMSKSTAVVFILLFSLLFRLEKFRWSLVLVVLFIFTGLFLFTFHSTQFNLTGFLLVITASVLSGLRWTLAQILLQKDELGLHNPIDMMYHIQPWMMISLLPLSVFFEGGSVSTTDQYFRFSEWSVLLHGIGGIMLGGSLGFMLEFSEYLLLSHTSSLTLSISGVFKELCILVLAYLVNHDPMNGVNALGLLVCLLGIIVHVITKAVYNRTERTEHMLNGTAESIEMLTKDGEANEDSESDEVDLFSVDRDR
uniref:Sugar phosphate transporter domain-containing protein n=1 Tax=Arion vulgaris TaxID=1028688 RepID=A0A0B6ZM18_9EUPU